MNIPTWAIVTGSITAYFLTGILLAMLMAYRAGRRGNYTFDGFDGGAWTLAWPVMCVIHCIHFVTGKYDAFLQKIQQYGHESTLPPKNASKGRVVYGHNDQWKCPWCAAPGGNTPGLVCECPGNPGVHPHGTAEEPCPNAVCHRCTWRGAFPYQ